MNNQFLTHSFTVDKTPLEVFDAINNVRGWWSGQIEGKTEKLGDEFTYQYEDLHRSTQKITESVPGKKVVWTISDSYLSFVEDKTEVCFTHQGLSSKQECFDACNDAWGSYILKNLITKGKGQPNKKEKIIA